MAAGYLEAFGGGGILDSAVMSVDRAAGVKGVGRSAEEHCNAGGSCWVVFVLQATGKRRWK